MEWVELLDMYDTSLAERTLEGYRRQSKTAGACYLANLPGTVCRSACLKG